jgi:hypothetical protein
MLGHVSWPICKYCTWFQKLSVYWMIICRYCNFFFVSWGSYKTLCKYCLRTLSLTMQIILHQYKMVLNPWQKSLSKIKIALHIFGCHGGWCFQMKTLASMYMIGGWQFSSHVKNVHHIQSYPHPNLYLKENLLENYGPHSSSHALGTRLLLPLLHFLHLGGYKCGMF